MKEVRSRILKTITVIVVAILFAALETTLLSGLPLFGATPHLLPFLAAAVAVFEGPFPGLVTGFFVGFLMDGLGAKSLWWYTVFYLATAGIVGLLSPNWFRKRTVTAMLWGTLILFLGEFLRFFANFYLFSRSDMSPVVTLLLPQAAYSVILSPLVIWPVSWLNHHYAKEPGLFR